MGQAGRGDEYGRGFSIGVDGFGNSYVTGFFEGSATFGPGEANQTTLTSAGGFDIFVAKYDSSGALQWAKRAGGTDLEVGVGIAVDGFGNSYVTGYFTGSATFGAGEANQTTLTLRVVLRRLWRNSPGIRREIYWCRETTTETGKPIRRCTATGGGSS